MKDNAKAVYLIGGGIVVVIAAMVFFMTRGPGEANSVEKTQAEARAAVPAGLGKPSKEQVQADLHVMGGGKKNSAPSTGAIQP